MKPFLTSTLLIGGLAVLALSQDWSPVPARIQATVEQADQSYRGIAQAYKETTGFLSGIAKGWGFLTEKTGEVFRLDFSNPLKTGQTWMGYTILGCDDKTPRTPCTIRYPEAIYWKAPANGYLTVENEYATFTSPEIPGIRFLFKGFDLTGSGEVKVGERLITSQTGEVQLWVQQGTENGWEFAPVSRESFYALALGGRR